jgi:PhnB protein
MAVKPIPEGYHAVTPYLAVDDATEAIEYYKKAFGAKERGRMEAPMARSPTPSSRSETRW